MRIVYWQNGAKHKPPTILKKTKERERDRKTEPICWKPYLMCTSFRFTCQFSTCWIFICFVNAYEYVCESVFTFSLSLFLSAILFAWTFVFRFDIHVCYFVQFLLSYLENEHVFFVVCKNRNFLLRLFNWHPTKSRCCFVLCCYFMCHRLFENILVRQSRQVATSNNNKNI